MALSAISVGLVCVTALLLVLMPDWRAADASLLRRAGLAVLLLGAAGAAMHGLRLEPSRQFLRLVANPRFAWPAVAAGILVLVTAPR